MSTTITMPVPGAWPVAASMRSTARTESASSLAKPPEASREPASGPPKKPATSTNRNTASRLRRGWALRRRETRPDRRGAVGSGRGWVRSEEEGSGSSCLDSPPRAPLGRRAGGGTSPRGRGRRTPGEVLPAPYGVVVASPTRRGRRPGSPDTRAAILAEARTLFAAQGYAGTSVRAVAAAAGVDAALVHHYFGTKDDLFLAALELPIDPRVAARSRRRRADRTAPASGCCGCSSRCGTTPQLRLPLLACVRGVVDPDGQRLLRDGFLPVSPRAGRRRSGHRPSRAPDAAAREPGPWADPACATSSPSSRWPR